MMPKTDSRPVYLNLFQFHFPPNALLSISHRIAGIALILTLPIWLILFNFMVLEPQANHQAWLQTTLGKSFVLLFWLALYFHWLAGARHLFIEFCINSRFKQIARTNRMAWVTFFIWLLGAVFIGWEVWS